jgi:hypothetical protein
MQNKIDNDINYLKSKGFEIVYSEKERVLSIEKDSMFIHGLKNMLIGTRISDTESYNILDHKFITSFKTYFKDDSIFGFSLGSRYISFDLEDFGFENSKEIEKNKIRNKISFLISMHINNNLAYLEKKERTKSLILSI